MNERKLSNGQIAAINFGLFVLYTLICYALNMGGLLGLLIVSHFFIGIIVAIALKQGMWALSAFAILLIGVATCVSLPWRGELI